MGHNAFVERYDRPNYKLHVIIFLAITAISVFLSAQVEKNREKADIAALKQPVPIDSIGLDDNTVAQQINPLIKPPVAAQDFTSNRESEFSANVESNSEYTFEHTSNLINVNTSLAEDSLPSVELSENIVQLAKESTEDPTAQVDQAQKQKLEQSASSISMDQVFQQQNDRFLKTLAKTAEVETTEAAEITQLKEAIRSDKSLVQEKTETPVKTANASVAKGNEKKNAHAGTSIKSDQAAAEERRVDVKQVAKVQPASQPIATPIKNQSQSQNAIETIVMTKGELDNVVSQFTNSYNEGDINRLMALFAENARTNDRESKLDIKADYAELFNNTKSRKLMINDINWQFGKGRAEGAAEFVVTVRPINGLEENSYRGQIKIIAIKQPRGVYITRLLHELKQ
ncbi:hypothetical protein [Kaarinaea lacus]